MTDNPDSDKLTLRKSSRTYSWNGVYQHRNPIPGRQACGRGRGHSLA